MNNYLGLRRRLNYFSILTILSCALIGSYFYLLQPLRAGIFMTDYGKFYQSARCFLLKKPVYDPFVLKIDPSQSTAGRASFKTGPNLNPPFFIALTAPLGNLSYRQSFYIWSLVSILCGVLSIVLVLKHLNAQISKLGYWISLLTFFTYFPTFSCLHYGQTTLFLLLLLVSAWLAARQKKITASAIILGITLNIKLFIGLFAFYFLILKQWRALSWFMMSAFICSAVAWALVGSDAYATYMQIFHKITWFSSSWNISLYGLLARLLGHGEKNVALIPSTPEDFNLVYGLLVGLILSIVFYLVRKQIHNEALKIDLHFSIITIALLLISPLTWIYYLPLLVIPCISLLNLVRLNYAPDVLLCGLWLLLFITGLPLKMFAPEEITANNAVYVFLGNSLFLLSLIFLGGIVFFMIERLSGSGRTECLNQPDSRLPRALLSLSLLVALTPSIIGIIETMRYIKIHGHQDIQRFHVLNNPCS
jgi:Glycosyltransferase family 87